MELWCDDIEALRAEARAVVDARRAVLGGRIGPLVQHDGGWSKEMQHYIRRAHTCPEAQELVLGGVRCRVFLPSGPPTAVYLHVHGSMLVDAPELYDLRNRDHSRRFDVVVVSVRYRNPPLHPFPAAPDDVEAVTRWLMEHGQESFGTHRLIIGGESFGAYLALLTLVRIRDSGGDARRICGAHLSFGMYDWGHTPSQLGRRPTDLHDLVSPSDIGHAADLFLPRLDPDQRRHPRFSPLHADLRDLPPAMLSVGTADHFLDDTLMLAPRYVAAGNAVELFVAPDMPHAFFAYPCALTSVWEDTSDDWFRQRLTEPCPHAADMP